MAESKVPPLDFGLRLVKGGKPFSIAEEVETAGPGHFASMQAPPERPLLQRAMDISLPFAPEGISQAVIEDPVMRELFDGVVEPATLTFTGVGILLDHGVGHVEPGD